MLDIKITNGRITDVANRCWITGKEVGIKEGAIRVIAGDVGEARRVVDAKGQAISPGFIDIHMHEEELNLVHQMGYDISLAMLAMGVTTGVAGNCGNHRQSPQEWITYLKAKGSPIHYLTYIGNNYLREQVGNSDVLRTSTKAEIEKMKTLVREAVDQGALGISYGLEYCPGTTIEEAIAIAEPIFHRKDMLLAAHYRKDGIYALPALEEMAKIGKETGLPFQISHLSSCCAYGNMKEGLELIDNLAQETDLQVDAYPYTAFSTFIGSEVFAEGCFDIWNKTYEDIELAEEPYRGQRCDKALFEKVRKEYPEMLAIAHVMEEADIRLALEHPLVMVASDGLCRAHQGHPRAAGTFPRVLGYYARDERTLDFFDALYKMTLMPAKRLGMKRKGQIKEGFDADITIFDPEIILDQATFADPQRPPIGIDYVLLDGKLALEKGKILQPYHGRFYRKSEVW